MTAPEPFGIEGALAKFAEVREVVPDMEPDPPGAEDLLRLELDACHQEITRLRHILGLVGDALRQGDEQ